MTNLIAGTIELVKHNLTSTTDERVSQPWQAIGMTEATWETLKGRIAWILADRKLSGRELAKRAGLRSATHVNLIRAGKVKAIEGDIAAKIARAGRVQLGWLLTGEGTPEPDTSPARAGSNYFLSNAESRGEREMAQAFLDEQNDAFADMEAETAEGYNIMFRERFAAWKVKKAAPAAMKKTRPKRDPRDRNVP